MTTPNTSWRAWLPTALLLVMYRFSSLLARLLRREPTIRGLANLERALTRGSLPSHTLQRRAKRTKTTAVFVSGVYLTHFVAPWAYGVWLWRHDRARWAVWNRRFVSLTSAGLATYAFAPAAPPWLASELGHVEQVRRQSLDGLTVVGLSRLKRSIEAGQANVNPTAAFPSMHAAYAALIALSMRGTGGLTLAVRVAYPIAMGAALVESGEHYVVDIVAGFAYALGAHLLFEG